MATTQNIIRVRYYWPSLFQDYIVIIKHFENCHIYATKTRAPPVPLHLVITANPFCKWGIDFMECQPPSINGHKDIIIVVKYCIKWEEVMPTFNNTTETTTKFFFNHVITHFGVPKQLVSNHGTHFQNDMLQDLSHLLGFVHDFSTPYYPRANG